jgi:hypothetical protein
MVSEDWRTCHGVNILWYIIFMRLKGSHAVLYWILISGDVGPISDIVTEIIWKPFW